MAYTDPYGDRQDGAGPRYWRTGNGLESRLGEQEHQRLQLGSEPRAGREQGIRLSITLWLPRGERACELLASERGLKRPPCLYLLEE
jgi:hypothetical protein